jgi:hypothetical protein
MNENIHIPLMSWSKKVLQKIWAIFSPFHLPAKKVIRLFLVEQSHPDPDDKARILRYVVKYITPNGLCNSATP